MSSYCCSLSVSLVFCTEKKKNIYRRERESARDRLAFFLTVTSR